MHILALVRGEFLSKWKTFRFSISAASSDFWDFILFVQVENDLLLFLISEEERTITSFLFSSIALSLHEVSWDFS